MADKYRPKTESLFNADGTGTWHEVLDSASGYLMFHQGDAGPRRAAREHFYTAANYLDELAVAGHAAAIRADGRTWRECVPELEQGMRDDFASAFPSHREGDEPSTDGSAAVLEMARILDDHILTTSPGYKSLTTATHIYAVGPGFRRLIWKTTEAWRERNELTVSCASENDIGRCRDASVMALGEGAELGDDE